MLIISSPSGQMTLKLLRLKFTERHALLYDSFTEETLADVMSPLEVLLSCMLLCWGSAAQNPHCLVPSSPTSVMESGSDNLRFPGGEKKPLPFNIKLSQGHLRPWNQSTCCSSSITPAPAEPHAVSWDFLKENNPIPSALFMPNQGCSKLGLPQVKS